MGRVAKGSSIFCCGFQRPSPPPDVPPPTPTVRRVAPPALGHESVEVVLAASAVPLASVYACAMGSTFPLGK